MEQIPALKRARHLFLNVGMKQSNHHRYLLTVFPPRWCSLFTRDCLQNALSGDRNSCAGLGVQHVAASPKRELIPLQQLMASETFVFSMAALIWLACEPKSLPTIRTLVMGHLAPSWRLCAIKASTL
jgi:hypothetical protein